MHHCSNLLCVVIPIVSMSLGMSFHFSQVLLIIYFHIEQCLYTEWLASYHVIENYFEHVILPLLHSTGKTVLKFLPGWTLTGQ